MQTTTSAPIRKAGKREKGNQPLLLLRFHVFLVVFTVFGSLVGNLGLTRRSRLRLNLGVILRVMCVQGWLCGILSGRFVYNDE